ncbi:hypothetical protein PvNV_038 [Penaeus vannamei nudivirus]|nr:hypothetical protein PvSNPV_038 [Penaeus vannamei nucleopolyhedrovirus]
MAYNVLRGLNKNKVVFTDIFNVKYDLPESVIGEFNNQFNFIIKADDIVNLTIFKKYDLHVNETNSKLKHVYVNPNSYVNESIIFTKPAPYTVKIPANIEYNTFYYPLHPLRVYDNIKLTHAVLNLQTINVVDASMKIWKLDPSLTLGQNFDILIQKLICMPIVIDGDTYNDLNTMLQEYQSFKLINITNGEVLKDVLKCDFSDVDKYNILGFDLSKINY